MNYHVVMMKLPTQADIAQALQVSRETVSYALNERPGVNPETRRKILAYAAKVKYQPHAFALAMRQSRSRFIGHLFLSGTRKMLEYSRELVACYAAKGYYCLNLPMHSPSIAQLDELLGGRVFAGLVLGTDPDQLSLNARPLRRLIDHLGIPVVYSGMSLDLSVREGIRVAVDIESGFRTLAKRLVTRGRKNFAFVGADSPANRRKLSALREALRESGLRLGPDQIHLPPSSGGEEFRIGTGAADLWDLDEIDTVMCANDVYAYGFMNAALRQGVKIPQQVQVTGCDNLDFSPFASISLSSIDTYHQDLVTLTRDTLLAAIEGQSPESHLLQPNIVERMSTGAA